AGRIGETLIASHGDFAPAPPRHPEIVFDPLRALPECAGDYADRIANAKFLFESLFVSFLSKADEDFVYACGPRDESHKSTSCSGDRRVREYLPGHGDQVSNLNDLVGVRDEFFQTAFDSHRRSSFRFWRFPD